MDNFTSSNVVAGFAFRSGIDGSEVFQVLAVFPVDGVEMCAMTRDGRLSGDLNRDDIASGVRGGVLIPVLACPFCGSTDVRHVAVHAHDGEYLDICVRCSGLFSDSLSYERAHALAVPGVDNRGGREVSFAFYGTTPDGAKWVHRGMSRGGIVTQYS